MPSAAFQGISRCYKGLQGAESIQTRNLTHASIHAAPAISRQPDPGWRLQSAPPQLAGASSHPDPKGDPSWQDDPPLIQPSDSSPFRSVHPLILVKTTPSVQLPHSLPCREQCPFVHTNVLQSPLPPHTHTPGWNPPALHLGASSILHPPNALKAPSAAPNTLLLPDPPTVHWGSCSLILSSLSLVLPRQRRPQPGTPFPLNFNSGCKWSDAWSLVSGGPPSQPQGSSQQPSAEKAWRPGTRPSSLSQLCNGERTGEGASLRQSRRGARPADKLQKWPPSTPRPHPHEGLTCVGTDSRSHAGDGVPGALRPQLSAGCARLPGSQSLGSTGLAKESRGLRAGVPEPPGSAAAISSLRPSVGIRGGLLREIPPPPGLTAAHSHLGGEREDHHRAGGPSPDKVAPTSTLPIPKSSCCHCESKWA